MLLYPKVQKRIQAEIDGAVGPGRLPTMADSSALPYLNAVARELMRWEPVSPIGTHASALLCARAKYTQRAASIATPTHTG